MHLSELTMTGLGSVGCAFIYNREIYAGHPDYDKVELQQEETANQNFWSWIDPHTKEASQPIFPREATRDIRYIIRF